MSSFLIENVKPQNFFSSEQKLVTWVVNTIEPKNSKLPNRTQLLIDFVLSVYLKNIWISYFLTQPNTKHEQGGFSDREISSNAKKLTAKHWGLGVFLSSDAIYFFPGSWDSLETKLQKLANLRAQICADFLSPAKTCTP